jgi:hypothetical protein
MPKCRGQRPPRGAGAALGLLLALAALPASAQQSPELPAKGAAPLVSPTLFYKGKGPGHDNSYVERFEEDYSYLCDPAKRAGLLDPLKFIPLGRSCDVYLSLNGESRFRFDYTSFKNFAIAPSVTPARVAGGRPAFAPATGFADNELYKQRYELGADLHLGPDLRFYADLYHGQQTGHDVGPSVPGNQRDELGLVDGFGEVYDTTATTKTGLRVGRQQVYLGNNLQVRANLSTNLPSPVFDGVRAYRDWGFARVDVFAYNVVVFQDAILQDRDNAEANLWGLYGSYDLPARSIGGVDAHGSIDMFYLGWHAGEFDNGPGSGMYDDRALLTRAKIIAATGAGFIASQDYRHTFGLRGYGDLGNIDYDWQGAISSAAMPASPPAPSPSTPIPAIPFTARRGSRASGYTPTSLPVAPARARRRCTPINRCMRTRNTMRQTTNSRRPISGIWRRGSRCSRPRWCAPSSTILSCGGIRRRTRSTSARHGLAATARTATPQPRWRPAASSAASLICASSGLSRRTC